MSRRAEHVDQTRQRIVDATVHLHGTVGPAQTTIAGIAEQAGVTRLTVYRHFPDEEQLFAACTSHWMSQQQVPDPQAWGKLDDPQERLQAGLTDLYRFYRDGEAMLANARRDLAVMPEQFRQTIRDGDAYYRDVLLQPFPDTGDRRLLAAAIGHATSFAAWRSLCVEQGLSIAEAVQLMTALVQSSAQ